MLKKCVFYRFFENKFGFFKNRLTFVSNKTRKLILKSKIMKNPKFVPDSEAKLDAPFWETGVNPVTMTKIHDTYDWTEDYTKSVDYGYKF